MNSGFVSRAAIAVGALLLALSLASQAPAAQDENAGYRRIPGTSSRVSSRVSPK